MIDTTSACYSAEDMDIVHKDFANTGMTTPAPSGSGVQLEIWLCPCRRDMLEVLPAHMRD